VIRQFVTTTRNTNALGQISVSKLDNNLNLSLIMAKDLYPQVDIRLYWMELEIKITCLIHLVQK
jgi:hypothetical protein